MCQDESSHNPSLNVSCLLSQLLAPSRLRRTPSIPIAPRFSRINVSPSQQPMPSTKNPRNHRQLPPHLVSDPSTRKQKVHILASASFDTYTTLLIYCLVFQFHNADAGPYESRHLHVVVTGSCYFDGSSHYTDSSGSCKTAISI